jgi:hypothetical protein
MRTDYTSTNLDGVVANNRGVGSNENQVGVQNAVSIGYDSRFPMKDIVTASSLSDSITKVAGNHSFKAGAYLEVAEYLHAHTGGSFTGSLNFDVNANNPFDSKNPFSNALLGNFQSYQEVNRRVDYDPINHVFE